MLLTERKIPKWKERELKKKGSFDDALKNLGDKERFVESKKDEKEKKEPEEVQ